MAERIRVREFEDEDLPAVLDLMAASLGETSVLQRTPEMFAWKHFDNPFGRSVILVAEIGGRIVGLRALMRWDLSHGDGIIPCGRAVDTATHPEFQRRGIFRQLTLEAIDAAQAAGIRLIFNTPNDRSRPGYLKMGWQQIAPIRVQVRPKPFNAFGRRGAEEPDPDRVAPGGSTIDVDSLPGPAGAVGGRAGGKERPGDLSTVRTPEYLTWRYATHPTVRYRSFGGGDGAVIVRPHNRNGRWELVVSDALGSDPSRALREAIHRTRAAYAIASFPAGSPARRATRRAGMVTVPTVTAMTLVARPLDTLDVDVDVDVLDADRWRLALGDLELL
jgi:GNAT superfamily N-acetyltransferase